MVHLRSFALFTALSAILSSAALGGETVLLDFTATWCGPCRSMHSMVERLAQEGLPVRQVDFDQRRDLASQFRVTSIPCFVMLVDGREVDRVVGATSYERLRQMFGSAGGTGALDALRSSSTPATASSLASSSPPASLVRLNAASADSLSSATGGAPAHTDALPPEEARPLRSSVRIKVDDAAGQSFGTGTIIDARQGEALVLTCGHLFRDSGGKGPITVELFGEGSPTACEGRLITYDLDLDLGLVAIRPGRETPAAPVAGPGYEAARGQRVTSVGCDNGQRPTVQTTRVTDVNLYDGPANVEAAGAPALGRSGGGLFDSEGRLIGVCFAADGQDDEGLYRAAAAVHTLLDRSGLGEIYRRNGPAAPAAGELASGEQTSPVTLVAASDVPAMPRGMGAAAPASSFETAGGAGRGNGNSPSATAPAAVSSFDSGQASQPATALSAVEEAALSEIRGRSANAEVICIIRPKDPTVKSEVIVLDKASPRFIEKLTHQGRRSGQQLTSLQVPRSGTRAASNNISMAEGAPSHSGSTVSETARRDAAGWRENGAGR